MLAFWSASVLNMQVKALLLAATIATSYAEQFNQLRYAEQSGIRNSTLQ